MAEKVESEYVKLFGTHTGRTPKSTPLSPEEKRRREEARKKEAARKKESERRATAVIKHRHDGEYRTLLEVEYKALEDDKRYKVE